MASSSSLSSAVRLAASSDLFEAPSDAYLLHACNCRGAWGSGIAAEFKRRFPKSFERYNSYCLPPGDAQAKKGGNKDVLGKALVLPPEGPKGHRVVCLMTSLGYGRGQSSAKIILQQTESALKDLFRQLSSGDSSESPGNETYLACCKINSGKFGVPWEKTIDIIEKVAKSTDPAPTMWLYADSTSVAVDAEVLDGRDDHETAGSKRKKGEDAADKPTKPKKAKT